MKEKKENCQGFTILELLIVVAILAVLIALAIPVFSQQLEKSRETTDLANVRSAYANVMIKVNEGEPDAKATVKLVQKTDDWQSADPITIGGVTHAKNQGDTDNWKGIPGANGECEISYHPDYGPVFSWSGGSSSPTPSPPFNAQENFFDVLNSSGILQEMPTNTNFEFDARYSKSDYIPRIQEKIESNSLLHWEGCTWAFLGNAKRADQQYLLWTSLNTDTIGGDQKIPVIIQTGDGKYYVSETTTQERTIKGFTYVTVSKHLAFKNEDGENEYQKLLDAGTKYSSLQDAYNAYAKALTNSPYGGQAQSNP